MTFWELQRHMLKLLGDQANFQQHQLLLCVRLGQLLHEADIPTDKDMDLGELIGRVLTHAGEHRTALSLAARQVNDLKEQLAREKRRADNAEDRLRQLQRAVNKVALGPEEEDDD